MRFSLLPTILLSATLAVSALFAATDAPTVSAPVTLGSEMQVSLSTWRTFRLGAEAEQEAGYPHLAGRQVLIVVDNGSLDQRGRHVVDVMADSRRFGLQTVVTMHNRDTTETTALVAARGRHPAIRFVPADQDTFQFSDEIVRDAKVLIWDVAQQGARHSRSVTLLKRMLEAASHRGLRAVVWDRPPILSAITFEGPPADGPIGLPPMPALTSAELAIFMNDRLGLRSEFRAFVMENWRRKDGNSWMLRGAAESSSISPEGRKNLRELALSRPYLPGTAELGFVRDFGWAGKPWQTLYLEGETTDTVALIAVPVPKHISRDALKERLLDLDSLGVSAEDTTATIDQESFEAIKFSLRPGQTIQSLQLGLTLLYAYEPDPRTNTLEDPRGLIGSEAVMGMFKRGLNPDQVRRRWIPSSSYRDFSEIWQKTIRYPIE